MTRKQFFNEVEKTFKGYEVTKYYETYDVGCKGVTKDTQDQFAIVVNKDNFDCLAALRNEPVESYAVVYWINGKLKKTTFDMTYVDALKWVMSII